MKTTYRLFIITFFTFFSMIVTDIHVEAKRFGGGRSIGNTPSISRSFSAMKQRTPQRQSSIFQQGSVLGGMGGIFTGLLAGTLLGSLLGGGAFSKISIIDILVFGGIIFLLYKLLTWKRHSVSTQYHYANTATERTTPLWTHLEDTDNKEHLQQTFSIQDGGIENFDIESFLKGAKLLFNRMQDSWASRDLEDIKKFTTKNIFTDITQQAQEDPTPSPIVVIHLQADVTGTQVLGEEEFADVLFKATLQEDNEQENIHVSEIWRFVRTRNTDSSWKLDGITQI